MRIPEYAIKNFSPVDGEPDELAILKKYYLDKDRIGREIYAEYEQQRKNKIFDDRYNRLNQIKSFEKLRLEILAMDELLNE